MLAVAIPFSPLTSPPSPPLSTSPTIWRCSSSPSCFHTSSTSTTSAITAPAPLSPLPPPPSPSGAPPARSPSPHFTYSTEDTEALGQHFSLDCASPTLSPSSSLTHSLSCSGSSVPTSPTTATGFSSSRVSRYLRHLPPMAQHHFYHWLHIRSLYESQFTHYVAANSLVPLAIDTETITASQPITFDSYRIHLTTSTTTVMPHATATTATSTSYRQLTSESLCLPPSPPLLASAGFIPPAPFSYEYQYPSHPFSYPPSAVLEALPEALRDEESWDNNEAEEAAEEEEEEQEEEEGEDVDAECEEPQSELAIKRAARASWMGESTRHIADDSDDEWAEDAVDGDATEADQRSSYAPSYAASYACSDAEEEEDEEEEGSDEKREAHVLLEANVSDRSRQVPLFQSSC